MYNKLKFYIGYSQIMNNGQIATVIDRTKNTTLTIMFEDGVVVKNVPSGNFSKGKVKNPYFKSVYNLGFIGEQKIKNKKAYEYWMNMMSRCYSKNYQKINNSYIGCSVCEEWLNFSNFEKWYEENYYQCDNEKMSLDKDILYKNNKIYSPNTCVFVPQRINSLFEKANKIRGKYPIGVYYHKRDEKFIVQIRKNKEIFSNRFDDEISAFNCYKENKEKYIKEIADEYKEKIPKKLYDAMYNYKVEVCD